ncbi:MAG: TolC family protein [Planctomycetes bacterium]|nr:TolC family protein [Planctomycetota bacterium]
MPKTPWRAAVAVALSALCVGCAASRADPSSLRARTERVRGAQGGPSRADPPDDPRGAAPELPEAASLDDYVRVALLRDPGIQEQFEGYRQALAAARIAGGWPDARVAWAHFVEPIETRTGPQRNRVSLTQPLPWPGELDARSDAASRDAEAAWWGVEARRREVVRRVSEAFFDLAFLARDRTLTADTLALLRSLEPVVQRRVEGGAPQADLVRLQVEIAVVGDALAGLDASRPAVEARLDALLDRDRGAAPLPSPELALPESGGEDATDEQSERAALWERHPELRALRERIAAERAREDVAELAGRPGVTVGVDWFETGEARIPGAAGSGDDPLALVLQLSLPFDRGRYRAGVEAAQHARVAAAMRLERRAAELDVELRTAQYRRADAARRIALHRDELLPRARQALALTETAYRNGVLSLSDWIDRLRAVLSFEEALWRAGADHGRACAAIAALTGGDES